MIIEISPVELHKGLLIKRDDKFKPFPNGVNGTKVREGLALIESNLDYCKAHGVITGCNLTSPQAPIVAAICQHYEIPCTVFYGGSKPETAFKYKMPRLAREFGATIDFTTPSGRQNVLQSAVNKRIEKTGEFCVKYGINLISKQLLLEYVGSQVLNIPKTVTTLNLVCGSGISTIGILLGLQKYQCDNIKRIVLFGNAPNRLNKIQKYFGSGLLTSNKFVSRIEYVDLYNRKGFSYSKREPLEFDGIELHPNYEAKAFNELLNRGYKDDGTELFWIIGEEIKEENDG